MTAPNIDEMRSLVIYSDNNQPIMDKLHEVPGWQLEKLGIPGGHEYCLTNGKEKVALREEASNLVFTSNVLPHDWDHDQNSANATLKCLSDALNEAEISNSITASQSDLA